MTEPGKPMVSVSQAPGERDDRSVARARLQPDVQAGATLLCYNKGQPDLTLDGLVAELSAQCEAASKGDLTRSEALLTAQAHTLDGLFNNLARRANGAQYLGQMEIFLRLALKAQGQCRATIEALAEIKNPRAVAFVTQANIAHGPQQVNNGVPANGVEAAGSGSIERAWGVENSPTKLLEHAHGERLDTRTAAPAVSADSAVEAVEKLDGTENNRG